MKRQGWRRAAKRGTGRLGAAACLGGSELDADLQPSAHFVADMLCKDRLSKLIFLTEAYH
jgi:hypothetical protein